MIGLLALEMKCFYIYKINYQTNKYANAIREPTNKQEDVRKYDDS